MENEKLSQAFQALLDAAGVTLQAVSKLRVLCNLMLQMNVAILENQYNENMTDKEAAKKACKHLEEFVRTECEKVDKMFDNEPKKPDPREWIKKE